MQVEDPSMAAGQGGAKCSCELPNGSEYAPQDLSVRGGSPIERHPRQGPDHSSTCRAASSVSRGLAPDALPAERILRLASLSHRGCTPYPRGYPPLVPLPLIYGFGHCGFDPSRF
jgi:hypothetical protein